MTAMRLQALPRSGRVIVDTVDDTFDIDLDAHIAVRWQAGLDGCGIVEPDETFMFDRIECHVGKPMWFEAWLLDEGGDGENMRGTTDVLGITPLEVAR